MEENGHHLEDCTVKFTNSNIESDCLKTNKEVYFKPKKLESNAHKENELDELLAENYYSINNCSPNLGGYGKNRSFSEINQSRNINPNIEKVFTRSPFDKMRPFSCFTKITESKQELRESKSLNRNQLSNLSGNQNLNNSLSTLSNKSGKITDAHRSLNIRMLDIKDKKIDLKEKEIVELKGKIQNLISQRTEQESIQSSLEKENELLKQQIKSLEEQIQIKPNIDVFMEEKERELANLERSLKTRYEEMLKSKLREKEIEFEHKLNNKAKLSERFSQHHSNSERVIDSKGQFNIRPYCK